MTGLKWTRAWSATLAGLLFLLPAPARAEATAQVFLEAIERGETTYLYLLYGYANGMNWTNTYLAETGQARVYCTPDSLEISAQQNVEILRQHLRRTPADADAPAGLALLFAYRATYPCPGGAEA